jgi:hypothetical protein
VRAQIAIAVILIVILIMTAQPVEATTISIPFVSTGCTAFMQPLANTACTIEEFNSASTTAQDAENLSISFPLADDQPALPFGSVDLAFPAMSQATLGNIASQRTYFFTDTF